MHQSHESIVSQIKAFRPSGVNFGDQRVENLSALSLDFEKKWQIGPRRYRPMPF